jgi:TMEM175 potassium channel family protein
VLDHLARADRGVLYLNLVMLLWVALIPWPTHLLAEYMREGGEGERVAAVIYAGVFLAMGAAFGALWSRVSRADHLLDGRSHDAARARTLRFRIGAPVYGLAILAALISAPLCLAICGLNAIYYALPQGGAMAFPDET